MSRSSLACERPGNRRLRRCSRFVAGILGALSLAVTVACGSPAPPDAATAASPPADAATDGLAVLPNTLSPEEQAAGWRFLFDGTTFAGWRGLGREDIPPGHWIIDEGAIRKVDSGDVPTAADGQPLEGGDIMTIDAFRDFELALEWKIAPGANSGIKYNVSEDMSMAAPPVHAALGFEYQILDDDLHPDAANGANRTTAALYDMIGPGPAKQLRAPGTYNTARIVFHGGHGEHWLNGRKVVEFDLETEDFAAMLAASKYEPIQGFAEKRAGHIVLQDHGDDVWFRSIKIRELPSR